MKKRSAAKVDTFCADHAPPVELWPVRDWSGIPELAYPDQMNCAAELLDSMIEGGRGDRTVFRFPDGEWTYRHLYETANRIANVLVDDFGLIPGNRVLLRGPNNPMLAACWFGVIKAGGVVVCTMPLLRERGSAPDPRLGRDRAGRHARSAGTAGQAGEEIPVAGCVLRCVRAGADVRHAAA